MRERAQTHQGVLSISTAPAQGTEIQVMIPLQRTLMS
jgi:signal transduction histidine kinase